LPMELIQSAPRGLQRVQLLDRRSLNFRVWLYATLTLLVGCSAQAHQILYSIEKAPSE
jgi:hypothetical protein